MRLFWSGAPMAKTVVEKITSTRPDVSIFKISGTLGYHENQVLAKFFGECRRKEIKKLIMDFSSLTSLGGGCARIIRDTAAGGEILIVVAGASRTVRSFLENRGRTAIVFEQTVEDAIEKIDGFEPGLIQVDGPALPEHEDPGPERTLDPGALGAEQPPTIQPMRRKPGRTGSRSGDHHDRSQGLDNDIEAILADAEKEDPITTQEPSTTEGPPVYDPSVDKLADGKVEDDARGHQAVRAHDVESADLHRKVVLYRALFSLSSDFNRIRDKSRLLDAFLLTTIAQVGVESAAFLEREGDEFVAVCWKGFETADPSGLNIRLEEVDLQEWLGSPRILTLDDAPLDQETKRRLQRWFMPYVAPFIVYGEFHGIVLLGKPIRKELDDASLEFLSMLFNQVAIAYEHTCRFEAESQRTLGLVHSLISMIEENTLSRGTSNILVNYTHALAVELHYPDEHIKDLLYGAVLRDIGMIKVSDLIVRSPRELLKEEWDIIKKHPIEGAEMLIKMRFSKHTVAIVRCHHERFNGEGYPDGLEGEEIPLGARIVAVVESYLAMLQERPTRPSLTREEALTTLRENWNNRYDPSVVAKFAEVIEEEIRTGQPVEYNGVELFKG